MSKKINLHRVLLIGGLTSLVIVYSVLGLKLVSNPVEYTGSDFITYFTVGTIANRHGLDQVYNFALQKAVEEEIVGFQIADSNVMPHNHIPLLNPLLALLVWAVKGRYLLGMGTWVLLLVLVYFPTLRMLLRLRLDLVESNLVNLLACFLFFPLYISLVNGQDTVLLVLGAVLLVRGVSRRQEWISGLGLALMTVRPQMALMMALPFLFTNPRVWWRFCAVAALFVIVSVAPLGREGLLDFFNIMTSALVGSRDTAMFNLIGILSRGLPAVAPRTIQAIGWSAYGMGVVGVCILWKKSHVIDGRVLSLGLVLSLLVSPHLVYHDLALLIVPLVVAGWMGIEAAMIQRKDLALVIVAISLILLVSFIGTLSRFVVVYLLMILMILYFAWPDTIHHWFIKMKKTAAID